MFFREQKAKRWTKKQINKNLNVRTPIDCEQYIHSADRTALAALKKIPLLDTVCSKILSFMNDKQVNIINMSSMIHITEKQLPKIHIMVKSICKKIGIDMPELYLMLNREPNAYAYGTENYPIRVTLFSHRLTPISQLYDITCVDKRYDHIRELKRHRFHHLQSIQASLSV